MKYIYLFYETDKWFSHSSRVLLGIFDSKQKGINTLIENHDIEDADAPNLMNYEQITANGCGYEIETIALNKYIG